MAVTFTNAPEQVVVNYGIVKTLPASYPRFFGDIFMAAPALLGTQAKTLKWRYPIDKTKAAQLMKRGGNHGVKKIEDTYFVEVSIQPGVIEAVQSLTADELTQMQPNGVGEWMIDGQAIPTASALAAEKYAFLRESVLERINIMCTQLINNGKVYFADGVNYWDFDTPAAKAKTYSASNGILKIVREALVDFKKINRKMPSDFLIGVDIVDKMLSDEAFQNTMYRMGYTNIARDVQADEKALIIGTVLGQELKQMDLSFDENGFEIIDGSVMKLLDRTQFRKGQGAIPVKNPTTKLPDLALMDWYPTIDEGTELDPTAKLILRNGFFPIVIDPRAIQTYNVTIS